MSDLYIAPLIGYRGWKVSDTGALQSMYVTTLWVPGVDRRANHDTEWIVPSQPKEVDHAAPHNGCSCGYYAFSGLERAQAYFTGYFSGGFVPNLNILTGVVLCWGNIIVHTQGFRAEYAQPVALLDNFVEGDEAKPLTYLREQAAMRYRIPILEPEAAQAHALERGRLWN